MSGVDHERAIRTGKTGVAEVYCLATMVAEEAKQSGCDAFAKSLEGALETFLASLSADLRRQALKLSYELAMGQDDPAPPRLRLAYSRD